MPNPRAITQYITEHFAPTSDIKELLKIAEAHIRRKLKNGTVNEKALHDTAHALEHALEAHFAQGGSPLSTVDIYGTAHTRNFYGGKKAVFGHSIHESAGAFYHALVHGRQGVSQEQMQDQFRQSVALMKAAADEFFAESKPSLIRM
jgi:hypothetical protein